MREILFRGKSVDSGKWLYGDLLQSDYSDGRRYRSIMGDSRNGGNTAGYNMQVNPDTVGQYTGLTDKNGVRIFEGDILGYVPWRNTTDFKRGVVKFGMYRNAFNSIREQYGFYIEWANDSMELLEKGIPLWAESVPVVGNVHDNPDWRDPLWRP